MKRNDLLLAVDIGNTALTVGVISKEDILFTEMLSVNTASFPAEYVITLKSICELNSCEIPDSAVICSVVPSLTDTVAQAVRRLCGCEPLIVGPGIKTGLSIRIDDPAQLGADLVAQAVAAVNIYPAPCVIADLSTATSISVISGNGTYTGGLLIPGLGISSAALAEGTSQLPHISLTAPERLIGRSTAECMKSGMLYGAACTIDGIFERIEEETGAHSTLILTGQYAAAVSPLCRTQHIYDPGLLFKGLGIIFKKNKR